MLRSLVGSEMCIRDSNSARIRMRCLIVLHWYMPSTSFRVFPPLLGRLHACTGKLLRLPSGAPAKSKNPHKEANLAGVPDDRPNSQTKQGSLHARLMIVANRRRVGQFPVAATTLLCVMRRPGADLLVMVRRVRLRYVVTLGLVCPTKPPAASCGHAHALSPVSLDVARVMALFVARKIWWQCSRDTVWLFMLSRSRTLGK